MFVLFGGLFLARNLGLIDLHYTMRRYWPIFLIVIGLNIVLRAYTRSKDQ